MSAISSIVLSSFSATATSSRLLDVTGAVDAIPEQLVQVGELLEVILGEEVGPQHHQVMLDLFGALLLDDDRAGAWKCSSSESWNFCSVFRHEECLDLGLAPGS